MDKKGALKKENCLQHYPFLEKPRNEKKKFKIKFKKKKGRKLKREEVRRRKEARGELQSLIHLNSTITHFIIVFAKLALSYWNFAVIFLYEKILHEFHQNVEEFDGFC